MLITSSRKAVSLAVSGLLALSFLGTSLPQAAELPTLKRDRLFMSATYLQSPTEGIYEVAFDEKNNQVFGAVIDRVRRAENLGWVYAFDPKTLEIIKRFSMPYRSFSLSMDNKNDRLFVGHTQSKSLAISIMDAKTGKVIKTSKRLQQGDIPDNIAEHFRHIAYDEPSNRLFIVYSNSIPKKDGTKEQVSKLLIFDPDTMTITGEVEGAYRNNDSHGFTYDQDSGHIFISGTDVTEIDPVKGKVIRYLELKDVKPAVSNLQGIAIDQKGKRIFATEFSHKDREGKEDGLHVFDLETGKQLAYVHTGAGALSVKHSPKHGEIYVSNFTDGTVSVVDDKDYKVKLNLKTNNLPNQMAINNAQSAVYLSVKDIFSRNWDPNQFVEGNHERILKISLDPESQDDQVKPKPSN